MRWSILQHSDHSGGDPAFIVSLAGGSSISQLDTSPTAARTPPGFSRWYFNFLARVSELHRYVCQLVKLKLYWLKPGGVPDGLAAFCSYEVELPPAKAWWCPSSVTADADRKGSV